MDTNILVSAFFHERVEREILKLALKRNFILIISPAIITELRRVLIEKFNVNEEIVESYIFRLKQISKLIRPKKLRERIYLEIKKILRLLNVHIMGNANI